MNATINILEVASELAHRKLLEVWDNSKPMYDGENYIDEAQDLFNDYYDEYYTLIEELTI